MSQKIKISFFIVFIFSLSLSFCWLKQEKKMALVQIKNAFFITRAKYLILTLQLFSM